MKERKNLLILGFYFSFVTFLLMFCMLSVIFSVGQIATPMVCIVTLKHGIVDHITQKEIARVIARITTRCACQFSVFHTR